MSVNIDKEFYNLIKTIEIKPVELIQEIMLYFFRQLSQANQKVLEDYFDTYSFWGTLHDSRADYDFMNRKARSLHEHLKEYIWLYDSLQDYRSKAVLLGVLSNWLYYTFMTQYTETLYADYFDLDIIRCGMDEVFVDAGAFTGDTCLAYINTFGEMYKRLYCYEITPTIFQQLQSNVSQYNNIVCRNAGLYDYVGDLCIGGNGIAQSNRLTVQGETKIQVTTLDEDISEPVSFIKMDIEGSEKQALKGSSKHIQNEKPKLAIAVYHDNDDLWQIPKMITELNSDYRLYLRYNGSALYPTEVTLLAI